MEFSSSCPRMLLHSYTEPEWLLPASSNASSLDRLEAGETRHWGECRSKVVGTLPPKPIGAQDNRDLFLFGPTPAELTSPPPITLNDWIQKYTPRTVAKGEEDKEESSPTDGDDGEKVLPDTTTEPDDDNKNNTTRDSTNFLASPSAMSTTSSTGTTRTPRFATAAAIASEQRRRRTSLSSSSRRTEGAGAGDVSMDISMSSSSFSFSSPLSRTG